MAMYTLNMLTIAGELARVEPAYEDIASKFQEHFLQIAHAITHICSDGKGLWDDQFAMSRVPISAGRCPASTIFPVRPNPKLGGLYDCKFTQPHLFCQRPNDRLAPQSRTLIGI